jgi:hypothetical protein
VRRIIDFNILALLCDLFSLFSALCSKGLPFERHKLIGPVACCDVYSGCAHGFHSVLNVSVSIDLHRLQSYRGKPGVDADKINVGPRVVLETQ